jgi:Lectin C-type domain
LVPLHQNLLAFEIWCNILRIFLDAFNTTTRFWISANDLGHEGSFYWDATGEALGPHTDWGNGEPNNANGDQHCAMILSNADLSWSDRPCIWRQRFICEQNPYQ